MSDKAMIRALGERARDVERRLGEAEDRTAIFRLMIDLQSAMDGRALDRYGAMFAQDGEWCAVRGRAIGPANITEFLSQHCKPWESPAKQTFHTLADVEIDLDGDKAVARGQWQHVHPDDEGKPIARHFGRFEAKFVRTSEGWRLKRRASYLVLPYIAPQFQLLGLVEAEIPASADGPETRPAGTAPTTGVEAILLDEAKTESRKFEEIRDYLEGMERRVQEIVDREAIYDLFLKLQDATDRRDATAYGQCFTPDGEWSGASGRALGRPAITAFMSRLLTPWASEEVRSFHCFSDLTIDLDGDSASARAQYQHFKLGDDGVPAAFQFCHYEAELERAPAGWLFKRRASFIDLPYVAPTFQLEASD